MIDQEIIAGGVGHVEDRLGSSFGTAAAAYAEHHPHHAQAAVRWALALAPGPRVLDLRRRRRQADRRARRAGR